MTAAGTQLVVHPATGEQIDVAAASTEQLAATVEGLGELLQDLIGFRRAIDAELLSRMDRSGSWTARVGDPRDGVQYELKAPSPHAGTIAYDALLMRDELAGLVRRGTIGEDLAEKVLTQTLTVELTLPFGTDADALKQALEAAEDVAGVPVRAVKVTLNRKVSASGANALVKVPGCKAALARARITVQAAARSVKVKAIRRGADG